MTTLNQEREAIKSRLQNKEHREAFVSASVDQTIPFQVRAIRLAKKWTQKDLAQKTGMKQERISTCENPNYGNFSLRTLKQLAAAFDVALIVRFAPFSELVEWAVNISPEAMEVPSFEEEGYFKDKSEEPPDDSLADYYSRNTYSRLGFQPGSKEIDAQLISSSSSAVMDMISLGQRRKAEFKEKSPSLPNKARENIHEASIG